MRATCLAARRSDGLEQSGEQRVKPNQMQLIFYQKRYNFDESIIFIPEKV